MKLIYCSILALLLAGCAGSVASPPAGEPIPDPPDVDQVPEAVAEEADFDLFMIIDEMTFMIEALEGELAAYRESDAEYAYVYYVQPGQSLWLIAGEVLGDPYKWVTIYSMNFPLLEDPDLIYPGQVLIVP